MPATALEAALIGRTVDLDALVELAAGITEGRGGTALVSGEAGIGKSRLVRELIARLGGRENSPLVLTGGCFEQDRSVPYAAIIDVLRRFLALPDAARFDRILDPVRGDLVTLVPELGYLATDAPHCLQSAQDARRQGGEADKRPGRREHPAPDRRRLSDHACPFRR